jgi:hypothetical protein
MRSVVKSIELENDLASCRKEELENPSERELGKTISKGIRKRSIG